MEQSSIKKQEAKLKEITQKIKNEKIRLNND